MPRLVTAGHRAVAAALAVGLALAAASAAPAPAAGRPAAQQVNQALVIVDTGTERRTAYVSFTAETISGLEALQLAGMDPVARTFGADGYAVCALCGRGCPADGSCLTCDEPQYWAYWRDDAGDGQGPYYSGAGAGRARVGHGDVEGWRWGTGDAPAFEPFDPPQPTTTTTSTTTPPSTSPPTTSRPPTTPPPTSPPTSTPSSSPPPPSGGTGGTGTTSGDGSGGPAATIAPGSSGTTAPDGSTSSAAPSSSTAPPSSSSSSLGTRTADGVDGGTSASRSASVSGEDVDGEEVAAVGAPDAGGEGGSVASTVAFVLVLGLVAGATVLVRRSRRARAAG